jgi:hypothetical protein
VACRDWAVPFQPDRALQPLDLKRSEWPGSAGTDSLK